MLLQMLVPGSIAASHWLPGRGADWGTPLQCRLSSAASSGCPTRSVSRPARRDCQMFISNVTHFNLFKIFFCVYHTYTISFDLPTYFIYTYYIDKTSKTSNLHCQMFISNVINIKKNQLYYVFFYYAFIRLLHTNFEQFCFFCNMWFHICHNIYNIKAIWHPCLILDEEGDGGRKLVGGRGGHPSEQLG